MTAVKWTSKGGFPPTSGQQENQCVVDAVVAPLLTVLASDVLILAR